MKGATFRRFPWVTPQRLVRFLPPFRVGVTVLAGVALLWLGSQAILITRSPKYLVAYIAVGVIAAFFLVLRHKYDVLLVCTGLSIPMYLSTVVLDRGVILDLTNTLLFIALLTLVGLATGSLGKPHFLLVPAVTVPGVAFLIACLLSFLDTEDRTASVIGFIQELEMLLIFLILVNAVQERDQLVHFLRGIYWGLGLECVIYVIQNILGFSFDIVGNTRFIGTTDLDSGYIGSQRGTFCGAPATAALYFSVFTLCLTGLYLCRRKFSLGLKVPLLIGMGVVCLGLAAKRAPYMGFVLGVAVMTLLLYFFSQAALTRLGKVLGVVAVPAVAMLPLILLRADQNSIGAYEERKNLTRIAWRMFFAHPLFGVGIGNYDGLKRHYLPEDWIGWVYKVHNHYMLVLAETGAVGGVCILVLHGAILVSAFRGIRRIARPYRSFQVAVVAALIAIYWEMNWDIFDSSSQNYIFWFVAALGVILPRVLSHDDVLEKV